MKPKMSNLQEIKSESNMILDVRQRPQWRSWIILSLQHVLAMFGATILVPMITGLDVSVALFSSGVGTLIYIAVTRARVPIYLGSSFAYIGAILAMYPTYGTGVFWGFLGVGVVYAVVATCIYFFGTGWLKKLLPPIVVGPMIMVIGLSLATVAIGDIGITADAAKTNSINWWGVAVAAITAGTAMFIALFFRGKMKLIPIMGAMLVGFVISLLVTTWHKDFVNFDVRDWSARKTYIGTPDFSNSLFNGEFLNHKKWFMPFLLMMPIAFVTIAEHIGDHTVLGKITGRDYINGKPGLHATLLGDGLATAFAGTIGGPANTSYGENTTTVGVSRVASVYVTGLAACFAIFISFFSIFSSVIALLPKPVIGGLEIVLYGFIASNGLKVMMEEKVDLFDVRNIFIIAAMLVLGIGGATIGGVLDNTAITFGGTSLAMFTGMILNVALPHDRGIDDSKMPKVAGKDPNPTDII